MRITSKGQLTIPAKLRLRLGLLPGTDVVSEKIDGGILIRSAAIPSDLMEERLRNARGVAARGPSTEEIMPWTRGEKP